MPLSDLTDLKNKLNHWLDELNQQGIFVEYEKPEERDLYLFEESTSLRISKSTFLRKKTSQPDVFIKLFGEIRGIQTGTENDFFILRELEPGSFRVLNSHFAKSSKLFKSKISSQLFNRNSDNNNITGFLKSLDKEESAIKLEYRNFNIFSKQDFDNLRQKLTGKKISSLSLKSCLLGKLPEDRFKTILKILNGLHFEKIDLSENQLASLTQSLLTSLFNTLSKSGIKEVNLDQNDLNALLNKNSKVVIEFLKKCSLEKLSLSNNKLDDTVIRIFATHSRIKNLVLESNEISDVGARKLIKNYFLSDINLNFNDISPPIFSEVREKTTTNRKALKSFVENHFIENAIVIAQGGRTPGNDFNKLPQEILITILAEVGKNLRRFDFVIQLCTLIIHNICGSPLNKLNWKKELSVRNEVFCDLSYARHFFLYHKAQGNVAKAEKYEAIFLQTQPR